MLTAQIDAIIRLINLRIPFVEAIYLFGSRATHLNLPDSDIDIAVLTPFKNTLDYSELFKLKTELEIELALDVDLIHLNEASTVFQFQITTTGKHLFVKNLNLILQYESLVLSMYQRLQEERKEIINEIIASGKIYA